ncbi:MAG: PIN domain-containing protein [Acidimicrobiales bacterium]|nr:PIN domain-containing protein [Acidimicrobiales bacterium]
MTIVDAGVIIAHLDPADAHHAAAGDALGEAFEAYDDLVVPASALAECAVGAARAGEATLAHLQRYLSEVPFAVGELTPEVSLRAARLRARHGRRLRLPDALVVATAVEERATRLLTTDRGWPEPASLDLPGVLVVV